MKKLPETILCILNGMKNNREVRIIDLTRFPDHRGSLTVIEELKDIPFSIKPAYWVYDVPHNGTRGGHAHHEQQQIIIALSGSFSVIVDNGLSKQTYHLSDPSKGLYISAGIWNTLENFSSGAVCMVLASGSYDEDDYIREYEEFLKIKQSDNSCPA